MVVFIVATLSIFFLNMIISDKVLTHGSLFLTLRQDNKSLMANYPPRWVFGESINTVPKNNETCSEKFELHVYHATSCGF